jgi:hypothetical protein
VSRSPGAKELARPRARTPPSEFERPLRLAHCVRDPPPRRRGAPSRRSGASAVSQGLQQARRLAPCPHRGRAGQTPAVHHQPRDPGCGREQAIRATRRTRQRVSNYGRRASRRTLGGRDARGPPATARPWLRKRTGHTRDATHSATRLERRTASESADPRRARRPRSPRFQPSIARRARRPRSTTNRATPAVSQPRAPAYIRSGDSMPRRPRPSCSTRRVRSHSRSRLPRTGSSARSTGQSW